MRFFDCNSPDIIGYSIATDGAKVIAILSHKQDQNPDRRLYEDMDVNSGICFWMYMPINQGEYITEIGRQTSRLILDTQVIGITLSTSRGRTVLFGLYGHENTSFERIAALPREPCRVYFNDLDDIPGKRSSSFFAFDKGTARPTMVKPGLPTSPDVPELPRSISTPPYTQSNEIWLHTPCSMLDVVEVHPCIDHTCVYRPVMGLLLYYADGHGESIGQFRLDWAVEPITITKLEKLYFYGKRTKKSWGYMAHVTTEPPGGRAQGRWLDVGQAGTLEWWFSSRHSVLFYNDVRLN
ncbi:Fc.00g032000.m01.CDS01 [Cosmosporella sp. VM-42]